jgi:hypothetical protein
VSSFTVGATSVTFTDSSQGFTERRANLLRTWDLELYVASPTDYATLESLWSGPVSIRVCPGSAGATAYADIAGGAGSGTLVIDNHPGSPFTAALTRLDRSSAYPGGGRRCTVTFMEVP